MMTNADVIIAYVNHSYGGAYKSLQVARRREKEIINICDFLLIFLRFYCMMEV